MNDINLQVGQRVHSILYGGRDGVIYAVHGKPDAASCKTLGGFISVGGSTTIDVVWEHGGYSRGIPESIARGVQWRLYDETVDSAEIQRMLDNAEQHTIDAKAASEVASRQFAATKAHLIANHPELKTVEPGQYSQKTAAANIRAELKSHFPGVKFSVRVDGNSIDVRWTDGVTTEKVRAITDKYKGGSFNGMEDIYEGKSTPWTSAFGSSDYLGTHRELSDPAIELAIDHAYLAMPNNLKDFPRSSVNEIRMNRTSAIPSMHDSLGDVVMEIARCYDHVSHTLDIPKNSTRYSYAVEWAKEALEGSLVEDVSPAPH